jgi:transcriptional regulator NrdR family protein
MAKIIIKKDGREQEFNPEKVKLSIRKAVEEAGLEEKRINEVVEKVFSAVIEITDEVEEKITSSQIREKILSTFDEIEEVASQSWRNHDRKFKS